MGSNDAGVAITELLQRHKSGDRAAFDQLIPLVYDYLRRIARGQVRRARLSDTLNTTALVHEAYLRLSKDTGTAFQDRNHFYAVCARAMRRIVVDYVRHRGARKRTADRVPLALDQIEIGTEAHTELILAVDEALTTLNAIDERLVRVVECRYFAGLTEDETAAALGLSSRTVRRLWLRARAWLFRELGGGVPLPDDES